MSRTLRRFAGDRRGAGALEFALVMPFLIVLYLGCSEAASAFTRARKVQAVTASVSDLISRTRRIAPADLTDIFAIAPSVMMPFDAKAIDLRASLIAIDGDGRGRVVWSCGNGVCNPCRTAEDPPPTARFATLRNTHVIETRTRYPYRPFGGLVLPGAIDLGSVSYTSALDSAQIVMMAIQCPG